MADVLRGCRRCEIHQEKSQGLHIMCLVSSRNSDCNKGYLALMWRWWGWICMTRFLSLRPLWACLAETRSGCRKHADTCPEWLLFLIQKICRWRASVMSWFLHVFTWKMQTFTEHLTFLWHVTCVLELIFFTTFAPAQRGDDVHEWPQQPQGTVRGFKQETSRCNSGLIRPCKKAGSRSEMQGFHVSCNLISQVQGCRVC